MCDTRTLELARLARLGADTWHELRQVLKTSPKDTGILRCVREELDERGDEGALRFLERVLEEMDGSRQSRIGELIKKMEEWREGDAKEQAEDWEQLKEALGIEDETIHLVKPLEFLGMPIRVDPSLKPGEVRLEYPELTD